MAERRIVLVEYFVTEESLLVFGVRSDFESPDVLELPLDHTRLRGFVLPHFGASNGVRKLVRRGLTDLWHAYDYLVAPIARWAAQDDIVYLVPHGLLHYLPLHALRLDGQYLIERNPVVYSPSASVLRYCQAKRKVLSDGTPARRSAAVFGDSQSNLSEARVEAVKIAAHFGVTASLGEAVTRPALADAIVDADIIHVAGHSVFDADDPLASGIELAAGDQLTARDVFGLRGVRAHLVTLSGCETGVNERRPGDELLGLTRAFLYAGTPSVLVTLWRVPDRSTAYLMERFYAYLRLTPVLSKVDALRLAVRDTRSEPGWESFYHWAPFVLIGDWQ